jgi:hypothetical protein
MSLGQMTKLAKSSDTDMVELELLQLDVKNMRQNRKDNRI